MKTFAGIAALVILLVGLAFACAPEFPVAVFSYHRHPDFPRNKFLNGELGVLEPTYARSYLVVAYRYLNGAGFTQAEKDQVRLYWTDRASGAWDGNKMNWAAQWEAARRKVQGTPGPPIESKDQFSYSADTSSWAMNCGDDAFRVAAVTLQDRTARYGRANPFVLDWAVAQDTVFDNCSSTAGIPRSAAPDAPAWLKADRAYQIAAAHLYSGDLNAAADEFEEIAKDASSPWHGIAPYLSLRVLERFGPEDKDTVYKEAQDKVRVILADPKLAPIHGMTRALFRRMREHVAPQTAVRELARAVVLRNAGGSLRQDLWDYTTVLDHFLDQPFDFSDDKGAAQGFAQEFATLPRQDEITDWIVTFQSNQPQDTAHAVRRWQATKSLPWLIAALSRISGKDAASGALIEASLAVQPGSPGYLTALFHRNRLRLELGEKAAARTELDAAIPEKGGDWPRSAVNHFRSLNMLTAPDLAGFLKFAQRLPVMVTSDMNMGETEDSIYSGAPPTISQKLPRWYRDSIKVFNERTPLAIWRTAAANPDLPAHLHQELSMAAFARATLLEDDAALKELAPIVGENFKEGRRYTTKLAEEQTEAGRHFAGVFFLLHYANVRPFLTSGVTWHVPSSPSLELSEMDSYVNNWWCALDSRYELDWDGSNRLQEEDADTAASRASFLQPADLEKGKSEFARLAATGVGPDYLVRQALQWAQAHPEDPRSPEALAFAVRTTRYGCASKYSGELSRQAHALLHSKFARTTWAAQTPYWFNKWYPSSPN
jgi:hypothetical protein